MPRCMSTSVVNRMWSRPAKSWSAVSLGCHRCPVSSRSAAWRNAARLLVVLADEQHERGVIVVREHRVPPPPAQEGVVAQELAVVLVDSPGAVVLDQVGAAATVSALDFQDGVGSYETRCGPSQAPDRAVVVESHLSASDLSGGF